ncbi:MAG TPA: ABC transporter permease [Bryobacteraceae bacterium]|nr:ABC transporter permease [Bryobacteraceae bacterium]
MFWRRRRESDLERELHSDLELEAEEQRDQGLSPERARIAARLALGNETFLKEEVREAWGWMFAERLGQDLRYAARVLARSPAFVAVAVLSLGLGIGGTSAMFALVNALLIRPLPYPGADRLVRVTGTYPRAALAMFREQSRSMDIASASPSSEFNLSGIGRTMRVAGSTVSGNLFSVLGVPVEAGRSLAVSDERRGADGVVVISHRMWIREFSADPRAIGRTIMLSGVPRQIVGVMPSGFRFPTGSAELWIPARLDSSNFEEYWGGEYVPFVARLRPGASLPDAQMEVRSLTESFRPAFPFPMPRNWNGDTTAIPLQADIVGEFRGKLLILFTSVAIVLVIACANVASLLFSRGAARRKEIALRAALGAGRGRIVRQLLTESVLLAALGAGFGVLVAGAALSVFKPVLPSGTLGLTQVSIDWQVAAFAAGLALLTGIAFGIAPALSASRVDLVTSIKTGTGRASTSGWSRIRSGLTVAEVALTVLLVVSAGLLLKSLYVMSNVRTGFDPGQVLTLRISPNPSFCRQRESCVSLYEGLLRQVRGFSGVSDVSIASTVPLDGEAPSLAVDLEDHPKSAEFPAPMFWIGAVSADYFEMLRIPIMQGRRFDEGDGAQAAPVAIVSASTAHRFWPDGSAIGRHIKPVWSPQWITIVGVAGDVRQFNVAGRDPDGISGALYMPYAQSVRGDHQIPAAMDLLISANTNVGAELRQIAQRANPDAQVSEASSLESIVSGSRSDFQSTVWLFLSFAGVSILLAAIGTYGLVSNSVAQRTYEIGLRVAIGATRQEILKLMLGQSLRLTLAGIGAGLVASIVLTRYLASLLFGVGATDPLTFTAVCGLMLVIAAMASYGPAWRAANLDPVKSLRAD